MSEEDLAHKVVEHMFAEDAFSRWLGISLVHIGPGSCELSMSVRPEMVNGFGNAHGGIAFSLADSALAFAANSHGRQSVALENVITYPLPVRVGDTLNAVAQEMSLGNSVATYDVKVSNQDRRSVALFRGTVYRMARHWFSE